MKTSNKQRLPVIAVSGAAIMLAGCSTVVRENIVASIDTGIGASVAENKQTQMYELKAGYIHSQFYSIPTGKVVANESSAANDVRTNRADITPQVVSGIKASTSLADVVLGMTVSENFAVGSIAVMSPAASAMYVADAKTGTNAVEAAKAVQSLSGTNQASVLMKAVNDQPNALLRQQLEQLIGKPLGNNADGTPKAMNPDKSRFTGTTSDYADYLASKISPGSTWADIRILGGANLQTLIQQLQQAE
jgi:hypothetical protein